MTNVKKFPIMAVGRSTDTYLTPDLFAVFKGCGCTVAEAIMDNRIPNPIPADMEMSEYIDNAERKLQRISY